jgi:hypothetical protein
MRKRKKINNFFINSSTVQRFSSYCGWHYITTRSVINWRFYLFLLLIRPNEPIHLYYLSSRFSIKQFEANRFRLTTRGGRNLHKNVSLRR